MLYIYIYIAKYYSCQYVFLAIQYIDELIQLIEKYLDMFLAELANSLIRFVRYIFMYYAHNQLLAVS